jgi:predicted lipoprotein with Yx(FWY)xxD motif
MQKSGLKRLTAGIGIGALCASAGLLAIVPAASASASQARVNTHAAKSAVVVKVAKSRGGFKNVLTTTKGAGATLYTARSCSGSCLSAWPPLFMPKGTTVPKGPKGFTGLGTVKDGKRLQVTYKKHRLYTFTGDSGSSVNGNGVSGFTVVTKSSSSGGSSGPWARGRS